MALTLKKITDSARWQKFFRGLVEVRRQARNDDALDRFLAELGPVKMKPGERVILGEGLWNNPNHFFRLRLFVEAMAKCGDFSLLGVLRSRRDWRSQRSLERIGFKDFIFIDEDDDFETKQFLDQSDAILAGVKSHRDLLGLSLPAAMPAYTLYDTVLKQTRHPQPALSNPQWRIALAETFRNTAIYTRELARRNFAHVVVSHAWKNEWSTLVWLALSKGIPSYCMTAYCDLIRIRRFVGQKDFVQPKDFLTHAEFDALPMVARDYLALIGTQDLAQRSAVNTTDINVRLAFNPMGRIADRVQARIALSGQNEKPIGIIYSHAWCDFPHIFGMRNFTDYVDWITATVSRAGEIKDVLWLLKSHPSERWQGGFTLQEIVRDLPPNVRVLPADTDSATALNAADAVVTVHGSIGLEASAQGVPTILADKSYYSDWGIVYTARDRTDYFRLLGEVGRLPQPDTATQHKARACYAVALASHASVADALSMRTDADGSSLYGEIHDLYANNTAKIDREVNRLAEFIDQSDCHSYATYHLVKAARAQRCNPAMAQN